MSKQAPKPSTGRIVRFVSHREGDKPIPRPALVIEPTRIAEGAEGFGEDRIDLVVFLNGAENDAFEPEEKSIGIARRMSIPYSEEPNVGTWHWPARE